jgi:hypothetical protein
MIDPMGVGGWDQCYHSSICHFISSVLFCIVVVLGWDLGIDI